MKNDMWRVSMESRPDADGKRNRPSRIVHGTLDDAEDALALMRVDEMVAQGLGVADSVISRHLGHTSISLDYAHYFATNKAAYMSAADVLGSGISGISQHVSRCAGCRQRAAYRGELVDPVGIEPTNLGLKVSLELCICEDCPFVRD